MFCGSPHPLDPSILCGLEPGHGDLHCARDESPWVRWPASARPPLSDRQRRILEFIADFHSTNGYAPSVREVAANAGLRSTATVIYHLQQLASAGYLSKAPGLARAMTVVLPEGGAA